MAGGVHSADKYKIANNRPVLVYSERQDWDHDQKQFHCIVSELRGSAMVTTHDERGKNRDQAGPSACLHSSKIF